MANKKHEIKKDELKKITQELDSEMGAISVNLKDLEAINTEMGRVIDIVNQTDCSEPINIEMTFRDIESKLRMVSSLLRYSFKDLNESFEESYELKNKLFDELVRVDKE